MFKAVLISSALLKREDVKLFAQGCTDAGLKVKEVKNKQYLLEALSMGFDKSEYIAVDGTLAGVKTIRNSNLFALGVGEVEKTNLYILSGSDLVLPSLFAINKKTVEQFNKEFSKLVTDFREDSIIGVLVKQALEVRENSYAPYSKFFVGAALLTAKNHVFCGCNVENASFGGTICAERGAAMTAVATEGKTKFKALAVVSQAEDPAPPCAICRQFLSEFADEDMQIYMFSVTSGVFKHYNFGTILPLTFTEF